MDSAEARSCLTHDVPLSNSVVMATLCTIGWWVIVYLSTAGWGAVAAAIAGVPIISYGVWRLAGPRTLWLTEQSLMVRERGRIKEFPLRDVQRVRSGWVPYKGKDLVLVGRGRSVQIVTLTSDTETLRHEVGRRLIEDGVPRDFDGEARRLLGLNGR